MQRDPKKDSKHRVGIWLPSEQYAEIKTLAETDERSVTSMVNRLIKIGLQEYKKKL